MHAAVIISISVYFFIARPSVLEVVRRCAI